MRRPDLLQPGVSEPSRPASDTGSAATRCARPAPGCAADAAWRQASRRARGRPRSSLRTCLPCPAEPARPAQVHAAMPARRCASPRRDDLAQAGCPPARSRSRRYRRCARPAVVPPRIRHTPSARPRDPRSSRTRAPEPRCRSTDEVVLLRRKIERPPGVPHGAGHIAPGHGPGRHGTARSPPGGGEIPRRRRRPSPPMGLGILHRYLASRPATARRPAAGLNALELADGPAMPRQVQR